VLTISIHKGNLKSTRDGHGNRDGQRVASQTVRGKHVYHLTLAPGSYVVSTLYLPAKPVTIVAGLAARADLPDDCE
jgi:hypothetical protein